MKRKKSYISYLWVLYPSHTLSRTRCTECQNDCIFSAPKIAQGPQIYRRSSPTHHLCKSQRLTIATASVFSCLCSRATVTLSWVAEYIPTFVTILHIYIYISFFRLGNIFKQRRRSLPQADKQLINPLFSPSQITLVDRKILVPEWICINISVITLVDKRPKNCLQLILIVHKKYPES